MRLRRASHNSQSRLARACSKCIHFSILMNARRPRDGAETERRPRDGAETAGRSDDRGTEQSSRQVAHGTVLVVDGAGEARVDVVLVW